MSSAFDPLTMLGRGGFDTHATLDLRGLKRDEALAKLKALIDTHAAPAPHLYAVLIDPATQGGGRRCSSRSGAICSTRSVREKSSP